MSDPFPGSHDFSRCLPRDSNLIVSRMIGTVRDKALPDATWPWLCLALRDSGIVGHERKRERANLSRRWRDAIFDTPAFGLASSS